MTTQYLAYSRELTGYRVRARAREAFRVVGFTLLVPAGRKGGGMVPAFAGEVIADGRLAKLIAASAVPPWVLGLGSWDPECEPHGQRYTICIEETGHTDFTRLAGEYPLFAKEIGASDWLCFELEDGDEERFWRDDPYKMMGKLGYAFHQRPGDYGVGLHFDAFPPSFRHGSADARQPMEFWITVTKGQPLASTAR